MLDHRSPASHLNNKRWLIPITNACNLSCGGCAQLCGHFPPDKIFHLSLDELDRVIRKPHTGPAKNWNELTIFGGEPTVHKQWAEIPKLLHSHAPMQFRINTNGRQDIGERSRVSPLNAPFLPKGELIQLTVRHA